MREVQTIGIVRKGKFFPMEKEISVEVMATGLVDTVASTPLNLTEHEGKVIMISGQEQEAGVIWAANIEDVANPILSALVLKVFNKSAR